MNSIYKIFKNKWYLVLVSSIISVPVFFGCMIIISIIGMITQNVIVGVLISSLIATFIVLIPQYSIYKNIRETRGNKVANKVALVVTICYYIVFVSLIFILGVLHIR